MDYVLMVREFYHKNNLAVPDVEILRLDPFRMRKRIRLMTEELGELVIALDEKNLIEIADACADLVYVVAGTAAALGISQADMSLTFEQYKRNHQGSTLVMSDIMVTNYMSALVSGLNTITEVLRFGGNTHACFGGIMKVIFAIAIAFEIPLDECYAEVHASNMSKSKLNEHSKGGKGEGYRPPDIQGILLRAKERKGSVESTG